MLHDVTTAPGPTTTTTTQPSLCGDGRCDASETCSSCFADCATCPGCTQHPCSGSAQCATCPGDCAFGSGQTEAAAVGLQSTGRIVATGFACNRGMANCAFALARYLTNGALDTTFGVDGRVITDFGPGIDQAFGAVIQPDDKIVAAGQSIGTTSRTFALARYTADGGLDPTFGVGGRVTTEIAGTNVQAYAIAMQADGKLVVAGTNGDFALVRYDTDGTVDTSFGTGGVVTTDFSGFEDDAFALAVHDDGTITAAGLVSPTCCTFRFGLAHYDADGNLDASFGTSGRVVTDIGSARALRLQADGRLVAAGDGAASAMSAVDDFAVARFLTTGAPDPTFNGTGRVTTNLGGSDLAQALGIQTDGKIVVVGTANIGSASEALAVVRYGATGTLDS